jgi:hypothetical protein
MNERINILIDQFGFGSYAEIPDTYIVHKNDLVEFAELIVRECIAQCEKNVDHEYLGWGSKLSAFNIKQHFGVEE